MKNTIEMKRAHDAIVRKVSMMLCGSIPEETLVKVAEAQRELNAAQEKYNILLSELASKQFQAGRW